MNQNLQDYLKEYRKEKNLSQEKMATILGIGNRTYFDIEKTGVVKKAYDMDVIKATTGWGGSQKIAKGKKENEAEVSNLEPSTLDRIARSNEILAEINKILAESHLKLVESNTTLTSMIKGPTERDFLGIPEAMLPKISDLLELIAEAGTKKWKSKDDALVELNKRFYGDSMKTVEKGSSQTVGK
jgi:transcriptional regulator with XRE-family HTH domain